MDIQIEKQNVLDGHSMGIQIACFLRLSFYL
nr:MAG TPA: Prolyl oligopeptidase family [Caudoviricetes sp.]DAF02677.1 MAG TPA: Prolyl oligopeptidase family [Caudoviricetes sp.]DAM72597.1 MAG TPA: Prolyl oligopeptidase family [Caudoviricetes sp.]DAV56144.1 MAG TPA: Prolyl oligopeptidase family [Caudoviricetes sp.]